MGALDDAIDRERAERELRAQPPAAVPFSPEFAEAVAEFLERMNGRRWVRKGLRRYPMDWTLVTSDLGMAVRVSGDGSVTGQAIAEPGHWVAGFSNPTVGWSGVRVDDRSIETYAIKRMAQILA